jgi:16S rRNA pseudouridine516 synthase
MRLVDMLFCQGFGTRRVCAGLVEQGLVELYLDEKTSTAAVSINKFAIKSIVKDIDFKIPETPGTPFVVQGVPWQYHEYAYLLIHKPAGYECSHRPGAWPSVYSLLPAPLRQRPTKTVVQGVQAVGRLDQDTTGALLLTDDGQFLHKMSSPKHHVPKVYQITTARAVEPQHIDKLLSGVVLNDDPKPVKAEACVQTGEYALALTLTQGKYHQVKRMIAAVGNHVNALHRSQIGALVLPADLAPGQWRWLSADDLSMLR